MGITRDTIEKIEEMAMPYREKIGELEYSSSDLVAINQERRIEPLNLTTLRGLLDYIGSGIDYELTGSVLLHIKSHKTVELLGPLNKDKRRNILASVTAELPEILFNRYMETEQFLIALQSQFMNTPDKDLLLRFAGTVEAGSVSEYGDDGVTQKATIRKGVASKTDAVVPNPVALKPYRTFLELGYDQPASNFIFRIKQAGDSVQCALFEADGGAWKLGARQAIYNSLAKALEDLDMGDLEINIVS